MSFSLLGIEAICLEIENPFAYDDNDLPLDNICTNMTNMKRNIDDLMGLRPSVQSYSKNISFLDDIDIHHLCKSKNIRSTN